MKMYLMISCMLTVVAASAVSELAVSEVRGALENLISQADQYEIDESALRAGFEIGKSNRVCVPSASFAPLVTAVSNHWQEVFQNIGSFGTNIIERTLLENTSWYFEDQAYLGALAMMCDNVETGALDVAVVSVLARYYIRV